MKTTELEYRQWLAEVTQLDESGAPGPALDAATRAVNAARAAGDESFALFFEGEIRCLQGDLHGGEERFRAALKLQPHVSFFHSNYAVLLSLHHKVLLALRHLDVALQLDSDNIQAWAQKSICLAKLNRHEAALECFDAVLKRDPENVHALRNKGISLARLGREAEALELFDRVLRCFPNDVHARSERDILVEEMSLRGTPLGWLLVWLRRRIFPVFTRLKYQR